MQLFNNICSQLTKLRQQKGLDYICLTQPIDKVNLMLWLKAQQVMTKMYWRDKLGHTEIAMLGICHEITKIDAKEKIKTGRYFGGIGFNPKSSTWTNYPHCRFIIPRVEIEHTNNQYVLRCHIDAVHHAIEDEVDACLAILNTIQSAAETISSDTNLLIEHSNQPTEAEWALLHKKALDEITKNTLSKVVLSRETRLEFKHKICPWTLLFKWQALNKNCYQFACQFNEGDVFIGCSPERLFKRDGLALSTEALAGTISRSKDLPTDQLLEESLVEDPKLILENTIVKEYIEDLLKQISSNYSFENTSVLKLNRIQHLQQIIHATLLDQVSDQQLIKAFHPTPAVGGAPKQAALEFILQHEAYNRGWYSGVVGYISDQSSDLCVSIRSALVQQHIVKLFAGAGIVKGSESQLEWHELDDKISTIVSLLQ